jgi:hypothetical protein
LGDGGGVGVADFGNGENEETMDDIDVNEDDNTVTSEQFLAIVKLGKADDTEDLVVNCIGLSAEMVIASFKEAPPPP